MWGWRRVSIHHAYINVMSTVDPKTKTMQTITRNISHAKILLVQETHLFQGLENGTTHMETHAQFVSNTGWFVGSHIEGFGLSRFEKNLVKSMKGMKYIMERLKDPQRH